MDVDWLLDQLCEMCDAGFAPTQSFAVVQWLSDLSDYPDKTVEALLALLNNPLTDQWAYIMHEGPIREILTRGLTVGTPDTKAGVEQLISVLSSKGQTNYTDILHAA